jgi:outer membrane protein OmpA-like peptidoglycan-associated protein
MRAPALMAFALVLGSCAGLALRGEITGVRDVAKKARERGAVKCSPKELALAEANLDFADAELDEGDFGRARDHLAIAEKNAKQAYVNSPPEQCAPMVVIADRADSDGDGCTDDVDKCPQDPEDKDGFQDDDCCTDVDNDTDTLCDPWVAEQQLGAQYVAVCQSRDLCPLAPEDKDGFQDEDGCPDPDNDDDRILDVSDQCPMQPEDVDKWQDEDGCPDPDNDADRFLDPQDKCPDQAEDYDGDADDDGCPDLYKLIVVRQDRIEIKQKILFKHNKWTISPKSFALMDEVVQALKDNPAIQVRVEGHTDSRGKDRYNLKLSQRRTDSVMQYLVDRGIESSRLEAVGYGETRPIADNKTRDGREANRRVEFIIKQQ